jgi:hypothetical protein
VFECPATTTVLPTKALSSLAKVFNCVAAHIGRLRVIERRKFVRNVNYLKLGVDAQEPPFNCTGKIVLLANV